ncbi:DNA-binding protein [Clostridium sp. SHJSY1]|uniref:PPC domain-containing DNA-binding protein n=1 Tax=Clostridium sp. SHJSY1 TaxID=2942483 RepID=UPI00287464C6|nr:DNA-binding protein [Clostridium sp. SHJSY1]MDS0524293.1 DNA-binding protein [Clostridium sp. SHJSY1]
MDYRKIGNNFYVRIDKDEEIISNIEKICKRESILAGHFQGIGACDKAIVSTYLPDKDKFTDHPILGMLEMVSLMGNITIDENGEPVLHSHGVFSYLDEAGKPTIVAGHLTEAIVNYTGEIFIQTAEEAIGRMIDPKTGISIWKF